LVRGHARDCRLRRGHAHGAAGRGPVHHEPAQAHRRDALARAPCFASRKRRGATLMPTALLRVAAIRGSRKTIVPVEDRSRQATLCLALVALAAGCESARRPLDPAGDNGPPDASTGLPRCTPGIRETACI